MTPSPEQFQKATNTMMSACEEMSSMTRDHLDATMKSATAISKGWEELTRSTNGMMQEAMARLMSMSKTMMGARTMRDITDMHNEMVKDMFDSWVASTGKISEISARLTQDVVGPMAEHTNNTITKIARKAKAA